MYIYKLYLIIYVPLLNISNLINKNYFFYKLLNKIIEKKF